MPGLLDAIRESCPEAFWARGVKLAREGAVHGVSVDKGEVKLRVLIPGAPRAFGVTLSPKLESWECDCVGDHEVCTHVAAAVIAWSEASKRGEALPTIGKGTSGGPGRALHKLKQHARADAREGAPPPAAARRERGRHCASSSPGRRARGR
jgi:uncharacterized Zn finger protein